MTREMNLGSKIFIGASEAGAALGIDRYRTPWQFWAEKTRLIAKEPPGWAARRGDTIEPLLLDWYGEKKGYTVKRENNWQPHPTTFWLGCFADGIGIPTPEKGGGMRIIEAKDVGSRSGRYWGRPGTDEIDVQYYPQAVVTMACYGVESMDFIVSIGGDEPKFFTVHRNEAVEKELIEALSAWYEKHITQGIEPDIDASDAYKGYISSKWTKHDDNLLPATQALESLYRGHRERNSSIKELEEEKSEIENRLRTAIADKQGILGDGWKITWKADRNGNRRFYFYDEK